MTTKEIYQRFSIPPNLRNHMFRVADVIKFMETHWTGNRINFDGLVKVALVHDLGNIVKFDFNKHPEFLGDEINRLDYWKEVQKWVVEKYGVNDHEATRLMLTEIGLDKKLIEIVVTKSFGNAVNTEKSPDWLPKLLFYADLRVLPNRIASLKDRLTDVMERMPQYNQRSDINDLIEACRKIEKSIQECLDADVSMINDENIVSQSYDQYNVI